MSSVKILAAVVLGVAVMSSGCGRSGPSAEPGTPSYCVESLIESARDGDIDLYLSVLPSELRDQAEKSRSMMGDKFDDFMRKQLAQTAAQVKGCSVTGEEIDGDTAKVTVTHPSGDTTVIDCIEEADGWKLDLLKR